MNISEQRTLKSLLAQWFREESKVETYFWNQNEVAVLIKENMELLDHWKQRRRGKSFRKGNQIGFKKDDSNNW